MKPQHPLRRAALALAAPCLLLGRNVASLPAPAEARLKAAGFRVDVLRFGFGAVDPFDARDFNTDTSVSVETIERQPPRHVQWFYSSRLVAARNGKSRVLWDMRTRDTELNPIGGVSEVIDGEKRSSKFGFSLRGVPASYGEVTLLWDALAQPASHPVGPWADKIVSLSALSTAARGGGVRLSRSIVLRRDGQKISKPAFQAKPPLRVVDATVHRILAPHDPAQDRQIVLRLAYAGSQAEAAIRAPRGLSVRDEKGRQIRSAYSEDADREGTSSIYRLQAWAKSADLKSVRRLRVEATVSDGKSWPLRLKAIANVPALKQ